MQELKLSLCNKEFPGNLLNCKQNLLGPVCVKSLLPELTMDVLLAWAHFEVLVLM